MPWPDRWRPSTWRRRHSQPAGEPARGGNRAHHAATSSHGNLNTSSRGRPEPPPCVEATQPWHSSIGVHGRGAAIDQGHPAAGTATSLVVERGGDVGASPPKVVVGPSENAGITEQLPHDAGVATDEQEADSDRGPRSPGDRLAPQMDAGVEPVLSELGAVGGELGRGGLGQGRSTRDGGRCIRRTRRVVLNESPRSVDVHSRGRTNPVGLKVCLDPVPKSAPQLTAKVDALGLL